MAAAERRQEHFSSRCATPVCKVPPGAQQSIESTDTFLIIAWSRLEALAASVTMSSNALKTFPLPTLDRPFGVALWPIFDKLYSSIQGYSPQNFRFVQGVTPMSTLTETAGMLIAYYIIIFGGREFMRNRPAYKLNGLFMIHNLYLTIISAGLLVLFIEQLLPTVWRHGLFYAICNHKGGWTNPLVILYYVG